MKKIVIVGAGKVGATFAYVLAQSRLVDKIAVTDLNAELASAQVNDIKHGLYFCPDVNISVGTEQDYSDADIVVITAGGPDAGPADRMELAKSNSIIVKNIVTAIKQNCKTEPFLLVVSNPVDITTYTALKISGFPTEKVIGSGTELDCARLKYSIGQFLKVDIHDIIAYVMGEHGDTQFIPWSLVNIMGFNLLDFYRNNYSDEIGNIEDFYKNVFDIKAMKKEVFKVIISKGTTNFAIALTCLYLVKGLLNENKNIFSVSRLLEGQYGIDDVCISVPCIVSKDGVEVLKFNLTDKELDQLRKSAETVRGNIPFELLK
jgi:L-lactate dehydrogenase